MSELARLEIEDRVATLTLNRPDARNALSIDLIAALRARVDELAREKDVVVCLVTGAGRAFCAGMDLKAVLDEPGAPAKLLTGIAELTLAMRALPMTTVAKVNGAAIGGGCGLMCVCDLAISHPDAKLGFPEVDLGVCPAVVAPWVVLKIGHGPARRLLLEGGVLRGEEALDRGLVNELVERDALDARAEEVAARLAEAGPRAMRETKRLLNELDGLRDGAGPLTERVRRGAAISTEVVTSDEARARLRAAMTGGRARK